MLTRGGFRYPDIVGLRPSDLKVTAMDARLNERRSLSPKDFAAFGLDLLAYIKPTMVDGAPGFAIHAADGTPLTVVAGRDTAIATVRRHEMEPVSVH